ncbi:hypothetical protein HPB52_025628 [Rhipicephalus sanguineus]|uniref:Uncharacterized protein n=1 Tax=Rhipicephalus sanguineus TaxID=34632 RepID=A0A9D4TCP0_RHISA|nr:hypothetical protein HPB52_025628 [Rhipicephalus sanguineus]
MTSDSEEPLTGYENPSPVHHGRSYQPRDCEEDTSSAKECEWKVSRKAIERIMFNVVAHSTKEPVLAVVQLSFSASPTLPLLLEPGEGALDRGLPPLDRNRVRCDERVG